MDLVEKDIDVRSEVVVSFRGGDGGLVHGPPLSTVDAIGHHVDTGAMGRMLSTRPHLPGLIL